MSKRCIVYFDRFFRVFWNIILIVYCISLLIPIVWMIFTASKSYSEYYENTFLWPNRWVFTNFKTAIQKLKIEVINGKQIITYGIWDMAVISIVYAVGKSLVCLLLHVVCAFVISRFNKYSFCRFLYLLGIFVMVTPIIGSSVSAMVVKKALGIYDNLLLTILTSCACAFSGFYFILLYGAVKSVPKSYDEAASIDGAGYFTILFKIVLPIILPVCTVSFVLSFLTNWNDYGTFLIWLPSWPNLSYGIYKFQNDASLYTATINEVMAGFAMIMIPTMFLYLSCNRLITSKFSVGGLKG